MEVQITRSNDAWKYDPQLDGYSDGAILKTTSGTPAVASNYLVLNNAKVASLDGFKNCNLELKMIQPVAPVAGQSKFFGLKNSANTELYGAVGFQILETVFQALLYDNAGNVVVSKTINWNSAWTNTLANYRISITERNVYFTVNDVIVARFEDTQDIPSSTVLFRGVRAISIENSNADDLKVGFVEVY